MNVLVTGGAGFIGSHVAAKCIELGFNTVVLDDLSGGFEDNIPKGAIFINGSINDTQLIKKLFDEYSFTYIYHLAAYAAEGLSHFIRKFNYENNLIGSINLINASINSGNVERFVFTSSIAVYGANQLPMTEDLTPVPEDPYGIAKYAIELDLKAAHELFGLNFTIFRPHNVYGINQNIGDRYRNVIGIFMNQFMKNEPMTIFGDGHQTRAFSHISSVAPIIAESILDDKFKNEIFNIGADEPCSVLELANMIGEAFSKKPEIKFLEARNEVVHAYASHQKLRSVIGEIREVSLREGIMEMAKWAISKGPGESTIFENIEVEKNLPPSWKTIIKRYENK